MNKKKLIEILKEKQFSFEYCSSLSNTALVSCESVCDNISYTTIRECVYEMDREMMGEDYEYLIDYIGHKQADKLKIELPEHVTFV